VESTSDLSQRIEALERENQDQKGQIYQLKTDVAAADGAITELQGSVTGLQTDLAALDLRVEALEARMEAAEAGLDVQLGWGSLLMAQGIEVRGAGRNGISAVGMAGLLASDAVIRSNGTGLSLWFGSQAFVNGSEVAGNDVDVQGGAGAFAYASDLTYSSISWGPMESDQLYE
jgi:TolA-binding protein